MKKLTLLAAMAVAGMGAANAQYVGDPGIAATDGEVYYILGLDAATVEGLTSAGKTVYSYPIDNIERFLYVWSETFVAGDSSYPGVDFQMDGYTSLDVASAGWSGAGFYVDGTGMDLTKFSDDIHFHLAFRSTNEPASVGFTLGDGGTWDNQADCTNNVASTQTAWSVAHFSVGSTAFVDNGTTWPLVGDFDEGGDWVAVDMKLSDIKKLYPSFSYTPGYFRGNIYSFLAGGVTGTNIQIDAVYFYGPANGSVGTISAADASQIVVSKSTISVLGEKATGIELYNISGQLVKKSATTVMGIDDIEGGVYIVKAGAAVKKVIIK